MRDMRLHAVTKVKNIIIVEQLCKLKRIILGHIPRNSVTNVKTNSRKITGNNVSKGVTSDLQTRMKE